MVTVCAEKVSGAMRAEQDRDLRGQTGGSARASTAPERNRATAHAWQWRPPHTPSRWARSGSRRETPHEAPATASGGKRRAGPATGVSSHVSPRSFSCSHARRLAIRLFEDAHDLRFQLSEIDRKQAAARMKYQVEALGKQVYMPAQGLSHAPLDAVAVMRLAQRLPRGDPNARAAGARSLRGKEPAHGCGLAPAAGRIGALVVGVLAQTCACQRLTAGRLRQCIHENSEKTDPQRGSGTDAERLGRAEAACCQSR